MNKKIGSEKTKLRVETSAFFEVALEVLDANSQVAFTPRGRSMTPTLRDAKDAVILERVSNPKKLDVALYRRDSGQYVLHRIVETNSDGTFTMCGDGQTTLERGIRREQILAKVARFKRGAFEVDCDRSSTYRWYSRVWVASRPIRALWTRAKRAIKKIIRCFFE